MRAFTVASLLALPLALAEEAVLSSTKRGVVYVDTENSADNHYWSSNDTDLTWYYNYEATPNASLKDSGLQFVPMLWGAGSAYDDFYSTVKGLIDDGMNITYALGFNEPDGCDDGGSCIDAEAAAKTWASQMEPLKDLGVKLGGPAVTGASTSFTWLQEFFTECAGKCSVDFMPVHWYGSFEGLASQVGRMNATYENISGIWVTEYNYPDQSLEDTQEFYNLSASFLDRVAYIDRYSMFASFRSSVSNVGVNATMLTQKGELTDIGAWYLGDAATGNIPKAGSGSTSESDATQTATFAGCALGLVALSIWWLA